MRARVTLTTEGKRGKSVQDNEARRWFYDKRGDRSFPILLIVRHSDAC